MPKNIYLTQQYFLYKLILSALILLLSSCSLLVLVAFTPISHKLILYIALLSIILTVIEIIYSKFKIKSYFIVLLNNKIVVYRGKTFHTKTEIYYSKIYSLEQKSNVLSKKFNYYSLSLRTIDLEFSLSGISSNDLETISNYISERI